MSETMALSAMEVRILGCLLEKQHTTPDAYPLTANALLAACNQTTNRNPVVSYSEEDLAEGIEALRQRRLIWVVSGGRAVKYEQRLTESLNLSLQEAALLGVLMLRGPQTLAELRSRAERMYRFEDPAEADAAMQLLLGADPAPLATRLPRLPGTKEFRFAHLLSGAPEQESTAGAEGETATGKLAAEVQRLREELQELRSEFQAFKAQF